jgi:eukaryotic-like serine/threonine-protein kinase
MAALESALSKVVAEQRPRAVLVEGPSSIGKSTLVRHFLADLKRRDPSALVLASRCHPQETLPFRALDAAMDALALHAATLSDLGTFAPALTQAAARLFPALWSVPALAEHRTFETFLDETDVRAQGFEELRDLFGRLATLGPLVLWIDDVQWDDADSLALLEAVLRPRGAPPILLILGMRSDSGESALVRRLLDAPELVPLDRIEVGALGDDDVAKLAAVFLGAGDGRIAGVVGQSAGNPFLACELARYVSSAPPTSEIRDLDVDDLVAARLRDLAPAERALLDVASIAVRPLATVCALEAAHLTSESQTAVLALRDAYLVRQGVSPAGETIAPYHDKIAEATVRLLSESDRRAVHRAIAETLERREPDDAAALCVHWEGAGETARASAAAYRAAENAAATLAFGRAAELYEKSLALRFDGVEKPTLFARAAAAHANDGRAHTAARRYLDASHALGDDVGVAQVRTFKRLAAEQFVKSGYVREGWEVMRSVLDGAGVAQPASPRAAMIGALGRRLRFLVRRIDVDAIGDRRLPEDERARLEILWTASTSMSMVNVTLSDAFRTLHLERILDVGDASSIARALAYEVALEVHVGGGVLEWHAERLLGHARKLVRRTGDPYDEAWLELGIANQAFCAGRFRDAVVACTRSDRILREKCSGVAWERTTVAAFLLSSLAMLGDLVALREHAERFVIDAENRGDLFGVAEGYSGECVLAWWSLGRGDAALATAHDAVVRQGGDAERWPEKTYRRGQLTELMGTVHLGLLAGDPWPAWRMMLAQWDDLKAAMLPSLQFYRSWLRHGRARVALAAAELGGDVDGWTRERLLADARDMARTMAKDKKPFGAPWAALIDGALAHLGGDRARATTSLQQAVDGFDRAGMALYREAARWRLGDLTGATPERARADVWLRGQGIPDVPALVYALVPGFGVRSVVDNRKG